jgi:beta-1,4-N-acetylglucosaminyltransferase
VTEAKLPRALLVCSPGGHLLQMTALEPSWRHLPRTWVTLPGVDVDHLLANERVVFGYGPTVGNRGPRAFLRNAALAWRLISDERPHAIISTGAGLAVPFFIVGRLFGCRLVYVESFTRVRGVSLSGRVILLLADAFFVQWPQAAKGRARYRGSLL